MCSKLYGIFKVTNLNYSDIIFKETHMSVFIEKSKADVYREGFWMHLPKLQSALCLIKLFKKYVEAAKIKESEEKCIFTQICHSKQGYKLKDLDIYIIYTMAQDILLNNLKNIGLNLHSLRLGGATAAANFRINDRFFQKHRR